jgi:methylphosphotriester-DNA--protein-cysteine methyltransferase
MSVTEHHPASAADQRRWEAVLGRDPGQDGKFVYGVASTHIYAGLPARHAGLPSAG